MTEATSSSPGQPDRRFAIGFCPVCEGGLCTIRVIESTNADAHGLVICDECEAIWLQPDLQGVHVYADPENALCPITGQPLFGNTSRWADEQDIQRLGWTDSVNPELTVQPE